MCVYVCVCGDLLSVANFRTEIPVTFKVVSGIFHFISNFMFIYPTISFRAFNDVPRNVAWGTPG